MVKMTNNITKLLESNNTQDVMLGLSLFCKLNDNPKFVEWLKKQPRYTNIIDIKGKICINFRFKGISLRFANTNTINCMYKSSDKIDPEYEYT